MRQSSPLFRKYAVVFAVLVSVALLISGAIQTVFAYQENQESLIRLQQEKGRAAAADIERFINDVEREIEWALLPTLASDDVGLDVRRSEYFRLLPRAPAVTDISYLDAEGKEQLRVSRIDMNVTASGVDRSLEAPFQEARRGRPYIGPVRSRNDTEPYLTIAVAEGGQRGGVSVAQVNLKLILEVVQRIRVGEAGYAYVLDADGLLIAHRDMTLVLKKTNLSTLPHVRQALESRRRGDAGAFGATRNLEGNQVLATYQAIDPPGWLVFVEQPLEEAFAPLYASLVRTGALLIGGLFLSVLVGVVLARRMVTPIRSLQAGATRIGAGALDQRIDIHTGDELESLAEEFNRMTTRLQESYAGLEQKVDERTRALGDALRQLEMANRHKSEFLANVSHELRTPLNAIIGFSDVIAARMVGEINEKQEEYLNDILDSGHHLLSLINDILDLSKVEAGRMELELSDFPVLDAIEEGLTMVREEASRRGMELSLQTSPDLGVIRADERKVKQILFNLLSNAVKFTADGGQVYVAATRTDGEVQVAVRDTGMGIASEDQDRVFEEFYRSPAATSGPGGTGLGLPLAKRFVELHGGRIWLESQPGGGSTFTFTLPLRQEARSLMVGTKATPESWKEAAVETSRAAVLVIEDDQHAATLMKMHLTDAGYEVAVARDVEEGLNLARLIRPHAITLDIRLPGADGWEFLTRAKADPATADIPVIVVSMVDERARGLALGAFDYLVKPIGRESLLSALKALSAA